jgi:hypothetical protein
MRGGVAADSAEGASVAVEGGRPDREEVQSQKVPGAAWQLKDPTAGASPKTHGEVEWPEDLRAVLLLGEPGEQELPWVLRAVQPSEVPRGTSMLKAVMAEHTKDTMEDTMVGPV